jgi:anti-sigma B factor antagonist
MDGETLMLFRIESEAVNGAIILRCNGALVHGEPSTMLLHAGETHSAHQLVVDLAGVEAVDASGLGALVGLEKWARHTGMKVRLLNPSRYLRELLQLTRLERIFEIVPAAEQRALEAAAVHAA